MIASIKGKITAKKDNFLVLEANGVGYKIFTTPKVLENELGVELLLHTYTQVREDAMALFGFALPSDLDFFELLITVSGVGPKMALSILSLDNTEMIKSAIANSDAAVFTKIGGVGKKTAEKIILELKDKIGDLGAVGTAAGHENSDQLLAALENFGYSNKEIKEVLKKLDLSLPAEEKLRQALKFLAK